LLDHLGAEAGSHSGDYVDNWRLSPWQVTDGFQLGGARTERRTLLVNGSSTVFELTWSKDGVAIVGAQPRARNRTLFEHYLGQGRMLIVEDGVQTELALPTYDASAIEDGHAGDAIRAPINGKVARVFVAEGQAVAKGDRIAVVEAMKMEHVLHAARDGTIAKVAAAEGAQVNQGALIASLAEESA
jgi:3-methylcrotonyl-CoA carboxylase alpha subunit